MTRKMHRSIPQMTAYEREALLDKGLEPSEWITCRMLAEYWGTTHNSATIAAQKGKLPSSIKLRNRMYFPRVEALKSWIPQSATDEAVWELQKTLIAIESGEYKMEEPVQVTDKPKPITVEKGNGKGTTVEKVLIETSEKAAKGGITFIPDKRLVRANYLRVMSDNVTPVEWGLITQKAVKEAIKGDWKARQWLSNYLIGTPIQRIESDVTVQQERFSQDERVRALQTMLAESLFVGSGLDGTDQVIEATIPDADEADGQDIEGGTVMDASPEEQTSDGGVL